MITFFHSKSNQTFIAVQHCVDFTKTELNALLWLFSDATVVKEKQIAGIFVGPRKEMITPWSTSAVEICLNMNIKGIERIEEFFLVEGAISVDNIQHDKMLQRVYSKLSQDIFDIDKQAEAVLYIDNITAYNKQEGLALNSEEIIYLEGLSKKLGRKLTDGEVFGFSQVNSEHCRHKIFNGIFIIDGKEKESSLFKLIKKTSEKNPNRIVSAYKDNCAFVQGPKVKMFYPQNPVKADFFKTEDTETVISLKAETHNFPTTVEPFNGAATGSGGEIRDRMAGGKGSFPIAGTAVYMTSYSRFNNSIAQPKDWEKDEARNWLYQTPQEILTKASNGSSDFGNKFGQPVICGSLLTFEHEENGTKYGYDKVIMLAGGVGFAKKRDALKAKPKKGDKIVLLGGDNYRIGMGGGAVSSVATGEFDNSIELNAIQRSNPEMQKRAYNAIRAVAENNNPIISVHDHGAGGHLNCLSELIEETGGDIDISKLPVGDKTLSAKEIIGNESQERMGLVIRAEDATYLQQVSDRERAPMYIVGEATDKHNFTLKNQKNGDTPIDLQLEDMFGSTPKTIMTDTTVNEKYSDIIYDKANINHYVEQVLQMEAVACKDWLTNKVDRSVTGLIAQQQCVGEIQLPLSNLGVTAIGYDDKEGIATSIGHAPILGMIDSAAASRMSISEALTNLVFTPLEDGIKGISLSANWMWPCRNKGEDARLYKAVEATSKFAIDLSINIPTGKDSLSMTQKYKDGQKVIAPGTLIISTVAQAKDIYNVVTPNLAKNANTSIIYLPFSKTDFSLGGSAFAQVLNKIGNNCPDIKDAAYFAKCFSAVQHLIEAKKITAGHDVSAGGLITTLLEMCFPNANGGLELDLSGLQENDTVKLLFSESAAVVLQVLDKDLEYINNVLNQDKLVYYNIGKWSEVSVLNLKNAGDSYKWDIANLRDIWYKTSYLFDIRQVGEECALERYTNYKQQVLNYSINKNFTGKLADILGDLPTNKKINAAIIREKGSNGDREMAWALNLAGFAVKDVHVTDLVSGREDLQDVNMIVFVGGFSNADTLGSAKGWAGALLYNEKAKKAIDNFYSRKDTMSLGICNGCQLMAELDLITPNNREISPKMQHNTSHKYESGFVGVEICESNSIMLSGIKGNKLGVWIAHGEGKFNFPLSLDNYNIAVKYTYDAYPANPNGSTGAVAGVCSADGRHLAMMPHPERCIRPYNWAYYIGGRENDETTPWMDMFVKAYKWLDKQV